MKRINWQRLATIGLCSSLVINAFSGATAVAEESSPTVASSAKEATSASSATPESTESSQETTETSREEVTQETAKPEELREDELRNKSQIKDNNSLRSSGTRALAQMPYRAFTIYFVSEDGSFIDPSLINMSANIMTFNQTALGIDPSVYSPSIRQPISIIDAVDHKKFDVAAESYTYSTNSVFPRNFRGVSDIKITVPKKYSDLTVKPTNYYSSSKSYPLPVYTTTSLLSGTVQSSDSSGSLYELTKAAEPNTFRENYDNRTSYGVDKSPVSFGYYLGDASGVTNLIFGTTTPIYYYLTNRRVTESFKDTAGATIPAPTGFTQGKQTSITSNNYTFKQAGTLPETYKASNGKTYKFKGWYKGKTKPNTLTTTKAPSYPVTYDDNDDLNVVYEEIKVFDFPALTYQFGFVDESGKRVDASTIKLTYDNWHGEGLATNSADSNKPDYWKTVSLEKGKVAPTKNNLKEIAYPAQALEIVEGKSSQYSAANLTFTLPKYYEKISVYNKNGTFDSAYPFPNIQVSSGSSIGSSASRNFELKEAGSQSFVFNQTTAAAPVDIQVPSYLREIVRNPDLLLTEATYYTLDKPVYYYLTNRKVTENFVDASGAKITAPTGFKQGKQTVIDSDDFTYTSAKALPASYTADGKSYVLQGWYKGTEKPATLETSKTPSYSVTYNDQDDLTVVYKEGTISADLTMRGAVDVIDNGAPMEYWEVLLKNTGEVPLTSIKIKPTTDWASGISAPTELFILGTGQNTKARPITKEQWEAGFEIPLDSSLPVGGQLTINLIGTKVTGQPGQVLKAAVEVTGTFGNLKASDTVRIKDLDQEIKEPTGEGFISVPTFDFGQVGVASATKQHGLKKAADYYGNGTRNPYVRISKTQPNWSLTAQLSQPKSATDSLPTATRLLLGAAPVSSFSNYNQPTELKNAIGTTNAIHLTANNAATSIIANQQFTGSDVYQLDFTFDNIKLEVPANQGTAGQQYQAAVTWNLVTGP